MNEMINASRQPIVTIKNGGALADSRDVAEAFGKMHKDVLRAIRELIYKEPSLGLRNFAPFKIKDLTGESTSHYEMDRDGFTLLAMGFTGERALKWKLRYIEAFNTMEAELRKRPSVDPMQVLNDAAAMRGLLLTYTEKVISLEAKVQEQAPDVAALERIAKSDGSLCITDAAKTLQIRPKDLFRFLRAHGWIYSRPGSGADVAYQAKIAIGVLEHKTTTIERPDGTERTVTQVRVTPKGLSRLAKEFPPPRLLN